MGKLLTILQSKTSGFLPTDLANLKLWLDASDASTITVATGVSQWDDKSGNDNHASQATSTKQPATGTRTQNSKNVLDFDGGDNLATAAFAGELTQGNTVFILAKRDSVTSSNYLIDGIVSTKRHGAIVTGTEQAWGYAGASGLKGAANTATINTQMHSIVFNGASSQYWIDGVSVDTGDSGSHSLTGLTVGASYSGGSNLNGFVSEILVYDSVLSTIDRQQVESYLSTKWAV